MSVAEKVRPGCAPEMDIIASIVTLLELDNADPAVSRQIRKLEQRLVRLSKIERMLERLIELELTMYEKQIDMFFDMMVQYKLIHSKLAKWGVLDSRRRYDADELGLLQFNLYGSRL